MRWPAALIFLLALAGCGESMDHQNRLKTYGAAPFPGWPAAGEALAPVPGTVARGALARDAAIAHPPQVNIALLQRGRERYGIYCAPCHGLTGAGDGIIVARGFPRPASFEDAGQMGQSAQHLMAVIGQGHGTMYGFYDRVEPADRWAIVAYIRALQLAFPRGRHS
jgi:mono/diheme cytochrome c family protein